MTTPRRWSPSTVASPIGRYSHLVEVPAGSRLIFISGQVGNLPDGEMVGTDVTSQTERALANIEALLTGEGAGPEHLVRLQSFVAGPSNIDGFRTGYAATLDRWFGGRDARPPGHTLLVVPALARPDILVEIEGWFSIT